MVGGRAARPARRHVGRRLRHRPRSSALAARAAQRRRAGGRNQRAAAAGRRARASRAGSSSAIRRKPAARCRAPIASRCCATPTATARPKCARRSSTGLNSPFGMALVGNTLYIANTDAVVKVRYTDGATEISRHAAEGRRSAGRHAESSLDEGTDREPRWHASSTRRSARTATSPRTGWTRKTAARRSGRSTSPPAPSRVFATGLRNPVGMAWEPTTGALWTVGQRARRAGQRPGARLHDLGARRRLLWLAV